MYLVVDQSSHKKKVFGVGIQRKGGLVVMLEWSVYNSFLQSCEIDHYYYGMRATIGVRVHNIY